MAIEDIKDFSRGRIENIFPSDKVALERLNSGEKLRIYLGIDPTGTSIHIGHTIPLLFLKQLLEIGHKPVLLIGDFTARIGDPTDKEAARTALTKEQVAENMKTYLQQIGKIIPVKSLEIRYNSEWLENMALKDVIGLASRVTVQQMIAREMFQERLKREKPVFLHEFLYPLMQGYDSVALDIDGEVGGNDQTFNMLVGRDLMQELKGKDKLVFTTRLLVDERTGKKVSKTEGEIIALNDSPQEIRRKALNLSIDDAMIRIIFELCTEKPLDEIDQICQEGKGPEDPQAAREALAAELVRMYHGEGSVSEAHTPISIAGANRTIVEFLVIAGAARSRGEAKGLVEQKAVMVNDEIITDWDYKLPSGARVQVGKGRFYSSVLGETK